MSQAITSNENALVALASYWVWSNPQALDRFFHSLAEEYGRTVGWGLTEVDLTGRYLEAVYERVTVDRSVFGNLGKTAGYRDSNYLVGPPNCRSTNAQSVGEIKIAVKILASNPTGYLRISITLPLDWMI